MRCENINQQLSEYVDGVLEPGRTERLESHLAECAACRNALEALRQTVAVLHDLEATEPPADLLTRVHAALATEQGPTCNRNRQHGNTIWALFSRPTMQLAVAASLLALVSIHVLHDPGAVSPPVDIRSRQLAARTVVLREAATEPADKHVVSGYAAPDSILTEDKAMPAEELTDAVLDTPVLVDPPAEPAVTAEVMVATDERERPVPAAPVHDVVQSKRRDVPAERNGAIWGGALPEAQPAVRRSPEAGMAKLSTPAAAPAPIVIQPALPRTESAVSKDTEGDGLRAGTEVADTIEQWRKSKSDRVAEAEVRESIAEGVETHRTEITIAGVDPAEILEHVKRLALSHHEVMARAARVKGVADYNKQSDDLVGHGAVDREVAAPRLYQVEVAADKYAELVEGLRAFKDIPTEQPADASSARERDEADNAGSARLERPVAKQTITLIITVVSR